ncbi:NAD(P)-dependent oxidoreductase [Legionella sp. W05-934-2]|uniref:NAD(P)-dependent oxidoreductase n=1 Tax=Legionella sp. W05-934-2 TaxID=1198649 RepID=UPI003462F4B3
MNPVVYIANPFLKPLIPLLHQDWTIQCAWDTIGEDNIVCMATSVWDKVDDEFLNQFPLLKMISHLGIGLDNIDLKAIQNKDIQLESQPQAGIHDTSELALALLLSLTRKLQLNDRYIRDNKWPAREPRCLGNNLYNKRLGLVGLGKIGKTIARFAQPFGMIINYTASSPKESDYHYFQDVNSLAKHSDYLVICCSGGEQTKHLINKEVLSLLGPQGYLINVSRGSVLDEQALIDALQKHTIAGAALDVFTNEPHVADELKQMENVLLSPHMGSSTHENLEAMFNLQACQLNNYLHHVLFKQ